MTKSIFLHLSDLTIKGFRGVDDLTIPRLGRVTLLTGRNSVGKTTVLEAVQAYAARGRSGVLDEILTTHQETSTAIDDDGDEVSGPDLLALFHRQASPTQRKVVVGPTHVCDQLKLSVGPLTERQEEEVWGLLPERIAEDLLGDDLQALRAEFHNRSALVGVATGLASGATSRVLSWRTRNRRYLPRRSRLAEDGTLPSPIICERIGPGLPDNARMARYMDQIALTEAQDRAIDALRLIFGDQVESVAFIGRGRTPYYDGLRPIVKFREYDGPVPLRSLGDGALRLFGIALALANSQGGFLLIDETENGIHHSLQHDFWRMVLQTAQDNDVQVLATTHSWDCVTGFAKAAHDLPDVDGLLVRLERRGDQLRAVEYTEEELQTVAEQGIEVR